MQVPMQGVEGTWPEKGSGESCACLTEVIGEETRGHRAALGGLLDEESLGIYTQLCVYGDESTEELGLQWRGKTCTE